MSLHTYDAKNQPRDAFLKVEHSEQSIVIISYKNLKMPFFFYRRVVLGNRHFPELRIAKYVWARDWDVLL